MSGPPWGGRIGDATGQDHAVDPRRPDAPGGDPSAEVLRRGARALPAPATADGGALIVLTVATGGDAAVPAASFAPEPHG